MHQGAGESLKRCQEASPDLEWTLEMTNRYSVAVRMRWTQIGMFRAEKLYARPPSRWKPGLLPSEFAPYIQSAGSPAVEIDGVVTSHSDPGQYGSSGGTLQHKLRLTFIGLY
jgi:hypothetical protein